LFDKRKIAAAFEFRHESWYDTEVIAALKKHSCSLCAADGEDIPPAQLTKTTNWGYVRLRRDNYSKKQLLKWLSDISSQGWKQAYVFFKHEDTAQGTKLATRFLKLISSM
jgi:uncharacterized protein YecE (DUF72 family)